MLYKERIAIILFNLGGPDSLESVQPFLFNLFNDKNIIELPNPFRYLLAKFISCKRNKTAKEIYNYLGGKSPLLQETQAQSDALEKCLSEYGNFKVFPVMRYWHPFAKEVVKDVEKFNPKKIILLPLYPQFSSSTTGSSIEDWKLHYDRVSIETKICCCYPDNPGFVSAYTDLILPVFKKASAFGKPRILFSAHGLPVRNIQNGDPYAWQIERSVESIVKKLKIDDLDYKISYQSRVGRLEWLKPYTDHEITIAAQEGVPLVLVPISFVSEHSETLVELDIEYKELALNHGLSNYFRVDTVGTHIDFIKGLAQICIDALSDKKQNISCPEKYKRCFCNANNGCVK